MKSNAPDLETCPWCQGTGWKSVGDARESRVTRCDCFLERRRNQLIQLAGIPLRHQNSEFSNYLTQGNEALAAARIATQQWAEQFPLDPTGILLIGPSGVGKTHLSVAAIKQVINKGIHCLFSDYRELLKQIQNSYNPSVETTELEVLRPVLDADVVVLDDLGAVKPTQWVWDAVSIVLNTRYNDKRTTIITTNFEDGPAKRAGMSATQAAGREDTLGDRIGERMRSRLFEMCRVIKIDGKDYRQKFRAGNFH